MKRLILNRTEFTDVSTIGELSDENGHLCWTLEDTCRAEKVDGITAIP